MRQSIGKAKCILIREDWAHPGYDWKITLGKTYEIVRETTFSVPGEDMGDWLIVIADDKQSRCYMRDWFGEITR